MAETGLKAWLTSIADEVERPQTEIFFSPEDRFYRLYPQYADLVRQVPVSIPALVSEKRNEDLVKKAYLHILMREADAAGFAHYLERLNNKELPPFALIMLFRLSQEGRQVRRKIKNFWWYWLIYTLQPYLPKRLFAAYNKPISLPLKGR